MKYSLLIVTPQRSFGEHIRQSLEGISPVHTEIVDNKFVALDKAENQKFTHAFLDTDLKNESIPDIGLALRQKSPNLRLVIISDRQSIPRFDSLSPWTLLYKPFFLPDLLRALDTNIKPALSLSPVEKTAMKTDQITANAVEEGKTLAWLKDVSKAAQHLTRLTLESSAQAALIIRHGEMWAYAGQLSDTASAELVKIVLQDKKTGDLLKFLRLNATQAEHMLYATELSKNTILSMVFDAETPFSAIRRQAAHLAESLAFSLQEPSTSHSKTVPPPEQLVPQKSALKKADEDLIDLFDFDEGDDLPLISDILENIPEPNPSSAVSEKKISKPVDIPSPARSQSSITDEPMPNPFAKSRSTTPIKHAVASSREESPAIRTSDFFETNQQVKIDINETRVQEAQPRQEIEMDLGATRVSRASRPETPICKPSPEELIETRPHPLPKPVGRVSLETSPTGTYDLTYACLLVPRFSTHHLTGDLFDRLSEWIPNICVAFGWRLEHLSVHPDYLQWVINVPPTVSPGYLMRIMRKQTSAKIFEDFPRQKKDNPSGDFWAPGYLIMGGSQPHPATLIKDYIERTRERQGA